MDSASKGSSAIVQVAAHLITGTVLLTGAAHASATQAAGIAFAHNDWELACDNTRTCRAAGYHSEDGEDNDGTDPLPVSVLLTRKAGPAEAVVGELQIGNPGDEPPPADWLGKSPLTMRVNDRPAGTVAAEKDKWIFRLTPEQTSVMLIALTGRGKIEWSDGKRSWRLSGKGATAVLLKMDEFQGRLGTQSALVRKGAKGDSGVLPPLPAPVIQAAPVPPYQGIELPEASMRALQAALNPTMEECSDFDQGRPQSELSVVGRLSATRLLVSTSCWTGAYNQGAAYWVVNVTAPYAPELVTTSASHYSDGTIFTAQKGRGIADCLSFEHFTWDGKRFVRTHSSSTGMCKSIAPGGAWSLPGLVTTVRKPAGSPP